MCFLACTGAIFIRRRLRRADAMDALPRSKKRVLIVGNLVMVLISIAVDVCNDSQDGFCETTYTVYCAPSQWN
jgi:hypothetical protein